MLPSAKIDLQANRAPGSITLGDTWLGADRTAVLSVGQVAGAMRLSVNGQLVIQQSTGGAWVVGPLLRRGIHHVEPRLDTTLANRMAALRASGARAYQTGPTPLQSAPSGLLGPVVLSGGALVALGGSGPGTAPGAQCSQCPGAPTRIASNDTETARR